MFRSLLWLFFLLTWIARLYKLISYKIAIRISFNISRQRISNPGSFRPVTPSSVPLWSSLELNKQLIIDLLASSLPVVQLSYALPLDVRSFSARVRMSYHSMLPRVRRIRQQQPEGPSSGILHSKGPSTGLGWRICCMAVPTGAYHLHRFMLKRRYLIERETYYCVAIIA